jgi:hypothetical protein
MKTSNRLALTSALLMYSAASTIASENPVAEQINCSAVEASLVESLKKSPEKVLEIVAEAVAANESCAGEIVKAAIAHTKANKDLVVQIVETAVTAAPKQIGEIATFAIATAPDANSKIIAAIQKFNAENGTGQALGFDPGLIDPKGSDLTLVDPKAGIDAPVQPTGINPLDFPSGPTQLFVDPKAGAAAPGVGAPGTPASGFVVNENTPETPPVDPVIPTLQFPDPVTE